MIFMGGFLLERRLLLGELSELLRLMSAFAWLNGGETSALLDLLSSLHLLVKIV